MSKRVSAMAWAAAAWVALAGPVAAQQEFPARPIRIVVPYPPGGSNDFLARIFSPKLTDIFGRQVIVDNRGGGNTIIGNDVVAKSAPDGCPLLLAGSSQVTIPHLYRSVPYDTINDFTPVAGIARSEFLLVVHRTLPVNSVREISRALIAERRDAISGAITSRIVLDMFSMLIAMSEKS